MRNQFYHPGDSSGFQYDDLNNMAKEKLEKSRVDRKVRSKDEDLIIEENTIYEIDRSCYERLKAQKKKKV